MTEIMRLWSCKELTVTILLSSARGETVDWSFWVKGFVLAQPYKKCTNPSEAHKIHATNFDI